MVVCNKCSIHAISSCNFPAVVMGPHSDVSFSDAKPFDRRLVMKSPDSFTYCTALGKCFITRRRRVHCESLCGPCHASPASAVPQTSAREGLRVRKRSHASSRSLCRYQLYSASSPSSKHFNILNVSTSSQRMQSQPRFLRCRH